MFVVVWLLVLSRVSEFVLSVSVFRCVSVYCVCSLQPHRKPCVPVCLKVVPKCVNLPLLSSHSPPENRVRVAVQEYKPIVTMLLEHGADPTIGNRKGVLPVGISPKDSGMHEYLAKETELYQEKVCTWFLWVGRRFAVG
jgi:hypothetical protein